MNILNATELYTTRWQHGKFYVMCLLPELRKEEEKGIDKLYLKIGLVTLPELTWLWAALSAGPDSDPSPTLSPLSTPPPSIPPVALMGHHSARMCRRERAGVLAQAQSGLLERE